MNKQNPGANEGAQIIFIGRPFGGWSQTLSGIFATPHFSASVEGRQGGLGKENLNDYAESDGITLFRAEKLGHIAPGQVFSGLTDTNINELPLNGGMTSTTTNGICVLNNGRIIEVEVSAPAFVDKYTPTSHTPVASSGKYNDILIFTDLASTPIEYAIWSWEYGGPPATSTEISIIKTSDFPATHTDGWFSGLSGAPTLKANVPHKLCKGPDGNIYVTDGTNVRQIVVNGAIASATLGNVLAIGAGWTATGIYSYKNYVAIVASSKTANFSRGETRVFLWNGLTTTVNGVTSTSPQFIFDIQDNFGNGIFFDGSVLYAFTNGRNNSSKIWEFTGKDFGKEPIFESALLGNSTSAIQGNLEGYQNSLMIGGVKNSLAHLFRLYGGGFHDEGILTDGTNQATDVGMVKNLYFGQLLIGVKYGSTYALFNGTNTNYQTGAALRTILYTSGILGRKQYPLGFKGSVNRFKIFLSQWGTGASLSLGLFKDYNVASTGIGSANDLLNLVLDTDTGTANGPHHKAYPVGTTEIDITDIAITDISSFYMIIAFTHASTSNTAAIIRDMIVQWSPSQ